MEECQEIYLKLSTDTEDFLKEQLVLSQSAHKKSITGTSVTVSTPEETTGNSVSQDEIHTENTANQKGKNVISPSSYQSSQEHVAEVQNSIADNVQGADNVITNDITEQNRPPVNANGNNTQMAFRMEKPKMPKFSGDVREFAIFKADFKHLVEARYHKRDSITILRASLNGKPLELIRGIGQDYDATWEHLESIYGDPRFVADTITQDIARFEPLCEGEDARFCNLLHLVRRSFNTLSEVGRQNDMDNNHMLAIIEQKMCSDDRKVWSRFLETKKCHAALEALMSWMTSEMKSRMRATAPLRSSKPLNVNQVSAFEEKGTVNHKCWLCKVSTHWTDQCQKFTSMSPSDRLKAVKENHGCFSCLKRAGRDHNVSNCSCRCQCSESFNGSQCKYFHGYTVTRLLSRLHGANATNSATALTVSSVIGSKQAILPVILVEILGSENVKKQGNLLLDSGAQVSLIKLSVADELGLKGKKVTITIAKVGGEEEELITKLFRVRIRSLVSRNVIHTVTAVGILCISSDITEIKLSHVAGIFALHTGETREAANLIARQSPLGWVIFGATPGKHEQVDCVFSVKVPMPIDMTDFWTTETMGVAAKPCECAADKLSPIEQRGLKIIEDSCQKIGHQCLIPYPWKRDPEELPNNEVQAKKKLEATEHRLSRTPEHAATYDRQMMEMTEMQFARKLTKQELETYKGPVHHIVHHEIVRPEKTMPIRIVFNSSASFQSHRLNDYWMKGPDLLDSLFGVTLRFRENEIAVTEDISKMFHRVLVPEQDQQVHRYLWRNMETNREPDVYVKTVLTFRDKPAPAMAQTALRKTADQPKSSYPEAAQVLKNNTYMDDICDSVHSVQQAKRLTTELDEVLLKGGFQVKGWLSNQSLKNEIVGQEKPEMKLLRGVTREDTRNCLESCQRYAPFQRQPA